MDVRLEDLEPRILAIQLKKELDCEDTTQEARVSLLDQAVSHQRPDIIQRLLQAGASLFTLKSTVLYSLIHEDWKIHRLKQLEVLKIFVAENLTHFYTSYKWGSPLNAIIVDTGKRDMLYTCIDIGI